MDDTSLDLPWTVGTKWADIEVAHAPPVRMHLEQLAALYAAGRYEDAYYGAPLYLHEVLGEERSAPEYIDGKYRQWISFQKLDGKRVFYTFSARNTAILMRGCAFFATRTMISRASAMIDAGDVIVAAKLVIEAS